MPQWTPELRVGEELAAALIAAQFPVLAARPTRAIDAGWDNAVFLVDDRWAFRFPQRSVAVPGLEREIAWLGVLGPLLPLPTPAPRWVGRPAPQLGYPWPFFGAPYLPGVEVAVAAPDPDTRNRLARPLAAFLRALHARQVAADLGKHLPVDPNRRADMAVRVPMTRTALDDLVRRGLWRPPPSVHALLEEALRLPRSDASAVVHGDLHGRHLLLDADEGVSGVIDWGDMALADPAVDLPLYWSLLLPAGRADFLEAYGPVARAALVRSRVLSLMLCAVLAAYGLDAGSEALVRDSLDGLDRTMVG
jgi:aminoglycoside phosphotransferase (APT) family kinase protein